MQSRAVWIVLTILVVALAPGAHARGCHVLIYNLWTTPSSGGYDNGHYDADLIAILSAQGHSVQLVDRAQEPLISAALLEGVDQLWLIAANNAQVGFIEPGELDAVADLQQSGGGVAIFGEHDDFFEDINAFAGLFGGVFVGFGVDHRGEISTGGFTPHPVWDGVGSIGGAVTEGDIEILEPGFLSPIAVHDDGAMVAIHDGAGGRVLLDTSFVRLFDETYGGTFDTWATEYDNEIYLANVSIWLTECGATPVNRTTWGRLKAIHR